MNSINELKLEVEDQIKLGKFLINRLGLDGDKADTLSNSLTDISKSMYKIYGVLLPKLYSIADRDELVELLWDIKEEFRHVDYHIKDAALDELHYIK